MLEYEFMRNAFYAIAIVTPLFGLVGTMIVNNKMAFFSDALGHSALTGIAIGAILGVTNPTISMVVFAIIFALLLNKIKDIKSSSRDTIISVFSSTAIAIGLVILSQNGNFTKFSNYLIGDILSIVPQEIYLILGIAVAVFAFWILFFNKLLAISVNPTLAKSKKIPVKLIENIFIVIIAVIVMLAIRWVGILIINSLLILPAASSRNISKNMRQYHFWAIVFSLVSGMLGLIISFYQKTATGPTIVIVASIIFFITYFLRKKSED
ncbi:MAG: metal ABC transporter permease [Clostridia bacterium]|nr:metal ABC transporter permease [Clostridia bacterium]